VNDVAAAAVVLDFCVASMTSTWSTVSVNARDCTNADTFDVTDDVTTIEIRAGKKPPGRVRRRRRPYSPFAIESGGRKERISREGRDTRTRACDQRYPRNVNTHATRKCAGDEGEAAAAATTAATTAASATTTTAATTATATSIPTFATIW
jgi:hypothetical protein